MTKVDISGVKMSKIAINNEIVLMRQAARKSRVSVVRKLIKEAKLLRGRKHGDEKVLEKCKRKAERLIAEIEALKKIKDDEITKFGITATQGLQETLSDPAAEPSARIMARLAYHKFLRDRILKFKEKFPSYEEFLGPGRRKMSKLQRKANREARNRIMNNEGASEGVTESENKTQPEKVETDDVEEEDSDTEASANEDETADADVDDSAEETAIESSRDPPIEDTPEPGSILRIKKPESTLVKIEDKAVPPPKKSESTESRAKVQSSKKIKVLAKSPAATKKPVPIKVISEEATVKRFTDLIEEKESSEIVESTINDRSMRKDVKIEKQIDSFFMTENGESEYMSVVVPKSKQCEDEDEDDRYSRNHHAKRQKTFHERNNKFFSKIEQRNGSDSKRFGSSNDKFNKNESKSTGFARSSNNDVKISRNAKASYEKKNDVKDEELHPSWQARKKQQEILKQGFQGKKIVFDD